mgnify:CR=1 FL=1
MTLIVTISASWVSVDMSARARRELCRDVVLATAKLATTEGARSLHHSKLLFEYYHPAVKSRGVRGGLGPPTPHPLAQGRHRRVAVDELQLEHVGGTLLRRVVMRGTLQHLSGAPIQRYRLLAGDNALQAVGPPGDRELGRRRAALVQDDEAGHDAVAVGIGEDEEDHKLDLLILVLIAGTLGLDITSSSLGILTASVTFTAPASTALSAPPGRLAAGRHTSHALRPRTAASHWRGLVATEAEGESCVWDRVSEK